MATRRPYIRVFVTGILLACVSVLAVATIAASIGMAQAQVSAPATPAKISTVYTGDVINGKKVVSSLNTDDLEPSRKHLLYFQGVQISTGQYWYVSVIVAKGARPRNENGFSAVSLHAGQVFNRLLKPNTDLAIDFHTGTTGLDVSAFHDDN